jgi:hypothetical protein
MQPDTNAEFTNLCSMSIPTSKYENQTLHQTSQTNARKRNGCIKSLKKELNNIIGNGALDNTDKLEANEQERLTL